MPIIKRSNSFVRPSEMAVQNIQMQVTHMEIREAVWSCRRDRAPGPDGFLFRFTKKYWELLKDDVVGFVHEFFGIDFIPLSCNSSFVTLIRKVDNPLTINEYRPISLIGVQ